MKRKINRRRKKPVIQSIIIFALFISGVLYLSYYFFNKLNSSLLDTSIVQLGTLEKSVKKDAVIIREQMTIKMKENGKVTVFPENGQRVSKNETIAKINSSSNQNDEMYALKIIDRKIQQLKTNSSAETIEYSKEYLDVKVDSLLREIQFSIKENKFNNVSELKLELQDIMNRGEIVRGIGDLGSISLDELQTKKRNLESSIANNNSFIKAPMAGLISSYSDNYDDLFIVSNMKNLTAREIKDCKQDVKYIDKDTFNAGDVLCLVVSNHRYYMACELNNKDTEIIKRDQNLTIKVDGVSLAAKFYDFYQDKDKKFVGLFLIESDVYDFLANRKRPVEIVYKSEKGILIPNSALTKKDGKTGVYTVDTGGRATFKEVTNILVSDEKYSLINFDYNKITNKNIVNLYDEIILTPNGIEEGRRVR